MKKLNFFTAIFVFFVVNGFAQNTFQPKQLNTGNQGVVYDTEVAVDFRLHTNGMALAVNFGKLRSYYKTRYVHLEIGEVRHPKEDRRSFDYPTTAGRTSRSFIFGKQNNLYVLRGGIGEKRYFSEKAKRKGLAVGVTYEAGPAIGLLKPYYLELKKKRDTDVFFESESYTEENADTFLDINSIFGSSGFTKGFGEIKFRPGIQAKAALHFDWGAFDEYVKAFEIGIMGDFFFSKVPIMVEIDSAEKPENRPFFINLYLTLQLGKRK